MLKSSFHKENVPGNNDIRFMFQRPGVDIGGEVRYAPSPEGNLFTVNERAVDSAFFQTFGYLEINFERLTGRLLSIDGRVMRENMPTPKQSHTIKTQESAYLITSSLVGYENIAGDEVKNAYDPSSKVLTISNSKVSNRQLQYAQVLSNVVVGLSDSGELAIVQITFP